MRVEIDQICKTFGPVRANDHVSMTLEGGHIYAILGENGAGKSTLMKILSGFQPPDSGQIFVDGVAKTFHTPGDALACGVGMLHQDPLDVPVLTALENFMLGQHEGIIPQRGRARRAFIEITTRMGFDLRPDAYVDTMTIGERQQLEIIRLIHLGAKMLILDEPTTGISAEQKTMLFDSLKNLTKHEGMTVILVSHKLEDVEALCDHVFVLRAGKLIGERTMPTPVNELVALMFGQSLKRAARPSAPQGNIVLHVENVSIPDRRLTVNALMLSVAAGEVIGLAGLDGSGQRAFLRACAGLQTIHSGRIRMLDRDITHQSYHWRVEHGMAYAPAGRLEEGLVTGLTITEHFALSTPGGVWIDWKKAQERAQHSIGHYNIRGRAESQVQTLSGGNQQRTLIALLPPELKLLLLEEPTRGLDVESARWVWQQLLARRSQGTAILFTSPDLDELVEYSDRILVFFGGWATLVSDLSSTGHATAERLGRLIGGKQPDQSG